MQLTTSELTRTESANISIKYYMRNVLLHMREGGRSFLWVISFAINLVDCARVYAYVAMGFARVCI